MKTLNSLIAIATVAVPLSGCVGAEPMPEDDMTYEELEVPAEPESVQAEATAVNDRFNIVRGGIAVKGYVEVNSERTWLDICDMMADNVGVYVEFYVSRPGQSAEYRTLSDSNGSAGGCGDYVAPAGRYIISLNGHSRDGASTGWKYLTH